MFAVIRVRGTSKLESGVKDTLDMLMLKKLYSCVLIPKTPSFEGMLAKVKDNVAWGEIKQDVLEKLVEKRARISSSKKIDQKNAKDIAKKISEGKMNEIGIKPVFNLSPPKKGFSKKGVFHGFNQGGELGYRADKINELVEAML